VSDALLKLKSFVSGKTVSVIGMGISNTPLINILIENGAIVTVRDKRTKEQIGDLPYDCKYVLGNDYLENIDEEIVFRTPGLRYDVPQLKSAVNNGSVLTSEMELFFELCPAKKIAVTGSDGKTTTTTLISEFIKKSRGRCFVGGNIGKPLLPEIDNITDDDIVVLELSSFQLHTMKHSPNVAVITNLSPNHLDYHTSYQEYIDAKKNIFLHQSDSGLLVLNRDNADTYNLSSLAKGNVRRFSRCNDADVYLKDGTIMYNGNAVLDICDIKIPGMHNVENYMAAIAATIDFVKPEDIVSVAKEFGGVPHRIELVRTHNGVKYYNSSIDSSPNRTINTLKVFEKPVILIAGGKDKGIPYDELGPHLLDKVKQLILIGATSSVIKESAINEAKKRGIPFELPVYEAKTYEDAVKYATEKATSGDVVLLSNASTSFDMFKNFEERGNLFKKIVKELV